MVASNREIIRRNSGTNHVCASVHMQQDRSKEDHVTVILAAKVLQRYSKLIRVQRFTRTLREEYRFTKANNMHIDYVLSDKSLQLVIKLYLAPQP